MMKYGIGNGAYSRNEGKKQLLDSNITNIKSKILIAVFA